MTLFIILICVIFIICLIIKARSHTEDDAPLTLYTGRNGSGKTFNSSFKVKTKYFNSMIHWWFTNKSWFKNCKRSKKSEFYRMPKPFASSNVPIILKKIKYKRWMKKYISCELRETFDNEKILLTIYNLPNGKYYKLDKKYIVKLTEPLDIGYLDNTKPFPIGSIIHLDEFSKFLNQFITIKDKDFAKEIENIGDNFTFWRHYHGNYSRFITTSQCSNEINYNIRYKLNQAICFHSAKHYLKFIHIFKYKIIDLTDNIKQVDETNEDNKNLNDKYTTIVIFSFKRIYDDRCFSERYRALDKLPMSNSPLKVNFLVKPIIKNDYNVILKTFDYVSNVVGK